MASEKDSCQSYCADDPNFAIICSFLERFAHSCGVSYPTFSELQEMIESPQDAVPHELMELHVKLLRKIRKSVSAEKWERALIKFCHSYYCNEEGWELERCGYKKCKVSVKLRILKTLCDAQFDLNAKLKTDVNKLTAEELRLEPLGKDKVGQAYWCQFDPAANVRVYKEDQDEETWKLVAKDRESLVDLITQLSSGEELLDMDLMNEDSNSQEIEKPITDTGQVEVTTSEENSTDNSNCVLKDENVTKQEEITKSDCHPNGLNEKIQDESCSLNEPKEEQTQDSKFDKNPPNETTQNTLVEKESESELVNSTIIRNIDGSFKMDKEDILLKSEVPKSFDKPENPSHTFPNQNLVAESSKSSNAPKEETLSSNCLTDPPLVKSNNISEGIKISNDHEKPIIESCSSADYVKEPQKIRNKRSDSDEVSKSEQIDTENTILSVERKRKSDESEDHPSKKLCTVEDQKGIDLKVEDNATNKEKENDVEDDNLGEESEVGKEIEEPVLVFQGEGSGHDCDSGNFNVKSKVGEGIEEHVMIFQGEGSGHDCDTGNPGIESEVGEEIEERVMIFQGEGSGHDCDTGNPYIESEVGEEIEEHITIFQGEGSGHDCDTRNPGIESEVGEEIEEPIMIFCGEGSGDDCDTGNPGLEDEDGVKSKDGEHHDSKDVKDSVENKTNCTSLESKTTLFDNSVNKIKDALHDNNKQETLPSEPENEDSIERKLSTLTGESYSSNIEKKIISEIDEKQVNSVVNCSIERGTRRKSCSEDTETEPPEAKKTKVENLENDVEDKNKNTVVEKEINTIEDRSESSNGIVDAPNVSNSSILSKDASSQKSIKSNSNHEIDNASESTIINEKEITGLAKEDSISEKKKVNCTLPSENKIDNTCSNNKTNKSNSSRKKIECDNDKILNDVDSNKMKNNTGNLVNTDETSNDNFGADSKCSTEYAKTETEKDASDSNKDTHTEIDKPEKSVDLSPSKSNSDNEAESQQKESIAGKKKSSPKKSPRPRKKLFTGRRSKKKPKKPLKETADPVNSDEEDLKSKLLKLEDEENKAGNKKKQNTDSRIEQLPNNKKADVTNKGDGKPSLVASRKRRGSQIVKDKESEEDATPEKKDEDDEEEEEVGGKKRKLKGKRPPNKLLRKSIEAKRNGKSSSEEDTHSESNEKTPTKKPKDVVKQQKTGLVTTKKKEGDGEESEQTTKKKHSKLTGPNSRKYSGIEINVDLMESGRSKRQSSRLAQLKIREQSDSKHAYEISQEEEKSGKKSKKKREEKEEKLKGSSKKKKVQNKKQSDDDEDFQEEETDKKKGKRRRRKKDPVRAFNQRDPWKYESSSGSSSENEEEEDHYDIVEEEEELPATLKSDHEFSPESDIENDEEWKPVRHARTAQKREPKIEAEGEKKDFDDDFACEKCGKRDHPEWILLCDSCDMGWHASCLRPSLMLVPEGDWHCPPCQHIVLVKKLQETLRIFDRDTKKRENEELRKKRLAYVGISLDNVLPANQHVNQREKERVKGSGSESSESSGSRSASGSDSDSDDEPVYQLRQRRQGTQSYRFNEYDDLINSAIQDEVGVLNPPASAVPEVPVVPTQEPVAVGVEKTELSVEVNGTVKDKEVPPVVSKPVKADKPKKKEKTESGDESSSEEESEEEEEEEEEFPSVVPKRNNVLSRPGKRKPRKLNSLDDPSDDDDDDEDFKGSSSEEEEEEDGSDDSDDSEIGGRGRSKRGHRGPVRRSSRARKSRFDKEFINDDSDDSDGPKRKKKKKFWTESDSDSEDSTWGRRKKKKSLGPSNRNKSKNKKFVIDDDLSESEANKVPKQKRQRKIKYGGLDDLDVEDLPASRRTRGRAINYQEVIGSESEEEIMNTRKKKVVIEDDDEFVADKEEEKEESEGESDDDDEEGDDDDEDKESEDEKDEKNKNDNKSVKKDLKEQKLVTTEVKSLTTEPKPEQKPVVLDKKGEITPIKLPPKPVMLHETLPIKTSPPLNNLPKEKPRRGRPPKAMIAPPPERLITEDDQYKAIVSKVSTLGHSESLGVNSMNINLPQHFPGPVTPIKIQNSSFDPKLIKRSPPIKIRSGVPVNASGRRSPVMHSPTNESPFFPVKSPPLANSESLGPLQKPMQSITARKSINPQMNINVKSENVIEDEDDLDDEDLMDDIEEDEDEEYSDDEILEEGEIPKKVAKRMERMEQKLEEKRLERLKMKGQQGQNNPAAAVEPKPPTNQPAQPLLRVVSPLKLMANPPGPLQSSFMNPGLNPRIGSPPLTRMGIRPPQPPAGMSLPVGGMDDATKRRGRGRGKKLPGQDNPEPEMVAPGGSVIQGMLQQPQSYPPTHFPPQRYPPPHPRIPFSPQRMMRPPFHPPHLPMDPSPSGGGPVKQEPVSHPPPPPPHSTAPPFHPSHRFEPRPAPPNYGPAKPAQYFPPPVHFGNYPPPPPPLAPREEPTQQTYPVQQPYNEQYSEEAPAPAPTTTSTSKDEESSGGEFGGLVSYFSSQREDDIDT